MPNPNIAEAGKGTRWPKGKKVPGCGRKPRLLKKHIKENNVGIEDQVMIFEDVIGNHDAEEIAQMIQRKKYPDGKPLSALVWGFLFAWLADCKRGWASGGINMYMRDRRFGKVPDKLISLTEDLTTMTPEERDAEIERLYQDHRDSVRRRKPSTAGQPDGAPGGPEEAQQEESGTPEGPDHD